jgi:hypothetical protein
VTRAEAPSTRTELLPKIVLPQSEQPANLDLPSSQTHPQVDSTLSTKAKKHHPWWSESDLDWWQGSG